MRADGKIERAVRLRTKAFGITIYALCPPGKVSWRMVAGRTLPASGATSDKATASGRSTSTTWQPTSGPTIQFTFPGRDTQTREGRDHGMLVIARNDGERQA
jgi:hypothetical protein